MPSLFSLITPFLHRFCFLEKTKKGHSRMSEEKLTKCRIRFLLFGSFFDQGEKYLLIFVHSNLLCFNRQNPSYLEFCLKSETYNWNSWVTLYFAPKTRFFCIVFFARFLTFFYVYKGPPTVFRAKNFLS